MSNKTIEWENIKVEKSIVDKLRSHKSKTGVSIMAFTRMAIVEKLEFEKMYRSAPTPSTSSKLNSKNKKHDRSKNAWRSKSTHRF